MNNVLRVGIALCAVVLLASCTPERAPDPVTVVTTPPPSGERLAYVTGCINCHHQTPKDILNAPSLVVVKAYGLPEFRTLLKTGVALGGRDMYAQGSIMGIVAREQLSHLTDAEVVAIHGFLQHGWTTERAATEEAKIALFPPPSFMKN